MVLFIVNDIIYDLFSVLTNSVQSDRDHLNNFCILIYN
jgi:hypothetical protein